MKEVILRHGGIAFREGLQHGTGKHRDFCKTTTQTTHCLISVGRTVSLHNLERNSVTATLTANLSVPLKQSQTAISMPNKPHYTFPLPLPPVGMVTKD